ncbi:JmjC domain-containing protein 4 [Cyberlindnera fabianii]|uniref:JmjC domain-containing protein 4 n=1 Tax=Cyberlindnera fabianii TaxID=36022 RepID=A0A1V2L5X1_CYBFA|nr:JmjC domain-containing protein 4 [Cyberlindnera fabianii]
MGKKHSHQEAEAHQRKVGRNFVSEYDGYYPDQDVPDVIDISSTEPEHFYKNYVSTRKPVIINGVIDGIDLDSFHPDKIVSNLHNDDQILLVEKKFQGGFGSGTERIKMTFADFMTKLKEEGENYYLTTQYTEDDPDEIGEVLQKLQENLANDESESDDDEAGDWLNPGTVPSAHQPQPVGGEIDDDDDDGSRTPLGPPPNATNDLVSDTDSIDFNDIHDDFDDLENSFDQDQLSEIVSEDVPGGPLTAAEADRRVHEFVQKPLTSLVPKDALPLQPSILKKLTPQQINIWIGKSKPQEGDGFQIDEEQSDYGLGRRVFGGGTSSGLHHDHADNLYIPISGSKRFTIFAPSDADKMYTVGNISKVFASGVIDYKNDANAPGWRELRGDSAIITEVAKWRLDSDESLTAAERDELQQLIEIEEEALEDFDAKVITSDGVKKDPPSFSCIPASILHLDKIKEDKLKEKLLKFAHEKWPKFFAAKRMTVFLKPGQMLFLPAGWFHEVTSFGASDKDSTDNIHIALNYWYSPPDNRQKVYSDQYWEQDFKRTLESCKHFSA